jgi:hypothetical protein
MAIAMVVQTLLLVGFAAAAFIAWRRTSAAVADARRQAEQQIAEVRAELRSYLDRLSTTVDETARALRSGTDSATDVFTDVRDALGTVRTSVGSVAQVVAGPRAALAIGLWQGFQFWRKRRAAQRVAADATSEL